MTQTLTAALGALTAEGVAVADSAHQVPDRPGLYAIHAQAAVWRRLGLGEPPDSRPLYVGKAERSLASRDVRTHFGTGKTGSSTVRRALAALLRDDLRLEAVPRNPQKPDGSANFGLAIEGDERLTDWMLEHLRLATWAPSGPVALDELETVVLRELLPPLNLAKVVTPWRHQVRNARAAMAAQARASRPRPS